MATNEWKGLKYYRYYNPNEKDEKDRFGDCVIRALTKVLDKTWLEVFDELVPIAREMQCMPNQDACYKKYLIENGYIYTGISNGYGKKRPTVQDFAKSHKAGRYFVRVANHVVAVVDGIYYDKWDCGSKCLYGYWSAPEKV